MLRDVGNKALWLARKEAKVLRDVDNFSGGYGQHAIGGAVRATDTLAETFGYKALGASQQTQMQLATNQTQLAGQVRQLSARQAAVQSAARNAGRAIQGNGQSGMLRGRP